MSYVYHHHPIKVVLIETHPKGHKGSMSRYADMLYDALQCSRFRNDVSIQRVNLAHPHNIIERFPQIFRSLIHHLTILINAAVRLQNIRADLFHIVDGSHAYTSYFINSGKTIAEVPIRGRPIGVTVVIGSSRKLLSVSVSLILFPS